MCTNELEQQTSKNGSEFKDPEVSIVVVYKDALAAAFTPTQENELEPRPSKVHGLHGESV